MKLRVVFFASIREELGIDRLDIKLDSGSVSDLVECLAQRLGEECRAVLTAENTRVAINQALITGNIELADGDEIAFFPPVTGG